MFWAVPSTRKDERQASDPARCDRGHWKMVVMMRKVSCTVAGLVNFANAQDFYPHMPMTIVIPVEIAHAGRLGQLPTKAAKSQHYGNAMQGLRKCILNVTKPGAYCTCRRHVPYHRVSLQGPLIRSFRGRVESSAKAI